MILAHARSFAVAWFVVAFLVAGAAAVEAQSTSETTSTQKTASTRDMKFLYLPSLAPDLRILTVWRGSGS